MGDVNFLCLIKSIWNFKIFFLKEDFDETKLKKLDDEFSAVTSEISFYNRRFLINWIYFLLTFV